MANFWDLPKPVREKIYRLHLVREGTTSVADFDTDVKYKYDAASKFVPPICRVSQKAEKEATPIYYGENHFEFGDGRTRRPSVRALLPPYAFAWKIPHRHLKLIRKVTYQWPFGYGSVNAREGFLIIASMKGLQELYIRVNEVAMIRDTLPRRHSRQHWACDHPTPQQQLAVLRHPGFTGLLTISGIPHVSFIKARNYSGDEEGGSMPGGVLETEVLPKLMASKETKIHARDHKDSFPFLSLPAELRNRIYNLLLDIDGPVHPSVKPPSSTPKGNSSRNSRKPTPQSALDLLAVNRPIHDEAVGIFYNRNTLEFYYPTQLHAFLLSLGPQRQGHIRSITLHYYNNKCGGIDLVDLTFPLLRQLNGLRRLHVIFKDHLAKRLGRWSWVGRYWSLTKANPITLPGIKLLFTLRGVLDIELRDTELDERVEELKNDKKYPDFEKGSKDYCYVRLSRIFEHLNTALAHAQDGKVNKKLLEDDEWHMKDVFPSLQDD